MKILEIIGHKDTSSRSTGSFADTFYDKDHLPTGGRRIGAGSQSVVMTDPDDPHMVKKFSRSPGSTKSDGFVRYAEIVAQEKLWENPHFPRIYQTNTNVDRNRLAMKDWQIEKLNKAADIPFSELGNLAIRYFSDGIKAELRELRRYGGEQTERYSRKASSLMVDVIKGEHPDITITDEVLAGAVKTLFELSKHPKLYFDLHGGNVMYRRTAVGIQLVFMDPFSTDEDWG